MKELVQHKEIEDEITSLLNYDMESDLQKFCDYYIKRNGAECLNYFLNEYKKYKEIKSEENKERKGSS